MVVSESIPSKGVSVCKYSDTREGFRREVGECERGGVILLRARRLRAALAFYKFEGRRDGRRKMEKGEGGGVSGEEGGKAQLVLFSCSCCGFQLLSIL